MAATTEVIILNNDNSKQFLFRGVVPFSNSKIQPSVDIPLINTTAANRVIFRFSGQQQDYSFTFALFNDNTDVSNGTHSSSVVTIAQQKQYLMDEIFTEDYNVDWKLTQPANSDISSAGVEGVIDSVKIESGVNGFNAVAIGTLTFKRGRIGAL